MHEIEINLQPAHARFFQWHNQHSDKPIIEVSGIFRPLILMLVEPKYDLLNKRYRSDVYDEKLSQVIKVRIAEKDGRNGYCKQKHMLWIPPYKMLFLDQFMKALIRHEVNVVVDSHMESGGEVKNAVLTVYDKYGIDETEMNFDSLLKQNIRYRQKVGGIIHPWKKK